MAIDGRVDGVKGGFLLGWVHDPARPGERVELDVLFDGRPLGRCVADVKRGDLVREGIGDGQHAFRLRLPGPLEPGSEHIVVVRTSGDGQLVPLSENYLADPTGDSDAPPLILRGEPGGDPGGRRNADPGQDVDGQANGSPTVREPPSWLPPRPSVPRALLGLGGWLFPYEGPERLARVLGLRPALPEKARAQVRALQTRHDRLAELGVGYLVVTRPNKAAVYAEHLPPGFALAREGRPADHLSAALRDEPQLEILDLLAALRDARRHGRVFLRQGEQLTWTGAFHGARAVIKELAKRFPAVEPPMTAALELGALAESSDELRSRERVTVLGGELVPIAAIDDTPERDPELGRSGLEAMYVPLPPELATLLGSGGALLERGSANGGNLPHALVVHDGTAERLLPFLAEHFARTLVDVSDGLPYAVVEQERPLVVVQIISEDSSFFA